MTVYFYDKITDQLVKLCSLLDFSQAKTLYVHMTKMILFWREGKNTYS